MRSRTLFGALMLAVTVLAACSSTTADTPATTTAPTSTTASPTVSSTMDSITNSSMDSSMPMSTDSESAGAMTTDGMSMSDTPPATGLTLQVATGTFAAGEKGDLSFKVLAADGSTINSYQVEQTKELHLVLVRTDLTGYQHLHPTRAADGTWSVAVTFAMGGTYRMVADFVPVIDGAPTGRTAVTTDLTITGAGSDTPLPAPATTATVDGYTVTIAGELSSGPESPLTFTVSDASGTSVTLQPYLGAFGHLVAFATSDLAYTHIHPNSADKDTGTLVFVGHVAAPGLHRLFMQFAADGAVHTAEFTIKAS